MTTSTIAHTQRRLSITLLCTCLLAGCDWMGDDTPFYKTLETPPAPVQSAAQALESFRIAPGFAIELVAAEPQVEDPVAMAWDAAGRLFVVEMRGFMPDVEGTGEERPVGRVMMLTDTDGDGRMDESYPFLEGLVLPRAVAVINDGLLVGEPPNLWLCPDIAGKTRCENRRRLGDYGADLANSNVEHLENGLLIGLDNWLYNAKSDRRMRVIDGKLEVQRTLPRGQWGIDKDNDGRLYYNTNSNFLTGDYFPANELSDIDSGVGKGLMETITANDEVFSIRVNPGVNRAYLDGVLRDDGRLHKPTAVSGLAVYRGHHFPKPYHDDIFVPEPAANALVQLRPDKDAFAISAEHLTYHDVQWGQREFLASTDERFRPVDATIGPDGALYVIDMYRGIIQHKAFLTDELRQQILERGLDKPLGYGRIWRIVHKNSPRGEAINLLEQDTAELVALLAHPNGWVRDTAQRLLLTNNEATESLAALIEDSTTSSLGVIHAIWTLAGRDELTAEHVQAALQRGPRIAVQALRAGSEQLSTEQLLALRQDSTTAPLALRLQLLFALHQHNNDTRAQGWILELFQSAGDVPALHLGAREAALGAESTLLRRLLKTNPPKTPANKDLLGVLARGFYQQLRDNDADPSSLLSLIATQRDDNTWRQLAMLKGLAGTTKNAGFSPWELPAAPALFENSALDADNPLWEARLDARRAFTWPGDEIAAGLTPLTTRQSQLMVEGETFYAQCASCHGNDGRGIPALAPPLAGSQWVTGPVEWLGRIILDGVSGPIEVKGKVWDGVMPGHRQLPSLTRDRLEGLLIYLRRSWGNTAEAPTDSQVAALWQSEPRGKPWTAGELKQVTVETGLEKYTGEYKISFITVAVSVEGNSLAMKVPMYGSSKLEAAGEHTFVATDQSSTMVRFEADASGRIDKLILIRDGSENIAKRVK